MNFGNQPFPPSKRFSLRAFQTKTLTNRAGPLPGYHIIYMNNINDYDGAGDQPYHHDQLAALYHNYRVDSMSFEVTFFRPLVVKGWRCCIYVAPSTTLNPTTRDLGYSLEKTGAMSKNYDPIDGQIILKGDIPFHQILGLTASEYEGRDAFGGIFGAGPSDNLYMYIMADTIDGSQPETIEIDVKLVFHGYAWENRNVAAS